MGRTGSSSMYRLYFVPKERAHYNGHSVWTQMSLRSDSFSSFHSAGMRWKSFWSLPNGPAESRRCGVPRQTGFHIGSGGSFFPGTFW